MNTLPSSHLLPRQLHPTPDPSSSISLNFGEKPLPTPTAHTIVPWPSPSPAANHPSFFPISGNDPSPCRRLHHHGNRRLTLPAPLQSSRSSRSKAPTTRSPTPPSSPIIKPPGRPFLLPLRRQNPSMPVPLLHRPKFPIRPLPALDSTDPASTSITSTFLEVHACPTTGDYPRPADRHPPNCSPPSHLPPDATTA